MNKIKIAGIQKLTLLDYPEKMAAILFLPGCNMNCPFCQNAELISNASSCIDYNDVMDFLKQRKNLLDGIVITGGEPTVQDISGLLRDIKDIGYSVKLDTNGTNPKSLQSYIQDNLIDYIAMDIKNSYEKYKITCGTDNLTDKIKESVKIIMTSNLPYEFRTTIIPELHTVDDIEIICRDMIFGADKYFLQPFVMSEDVPVKTFTEPKDSLLSEMRQTAKKYISNTEIRGRDISA